MYRRSVTFHHKLQCQVPCHDRHAFAWPVSNVGYSHVVFSLCSASLKHASIQGPRFLLRHCSRKHLSQPAIHTCMPNFAVHIVQVPVWRQRMHIFAASECQGRYALQNLCQDETPAKQLVHSIQACKCTFLSHLKMVTCA